MGDIHQPRIDVARKAMSAAGAGALLVTSPPNIRWLTGFSGSAGRVLLGRDGPPMLVTDGRYELRAAREAPGADVVLDRTWDWLPAHTTPGERLAVEADDLSWSTVQQLAAMLDDVELVAVDAALSTGRALKDTEEQDRLRHACAITTRAFDQACGWLAPGLTEREISRRLHDELLDLGADGTAFPSIVASGPNGAVPHHDPTDRALDTGDLVTMDFGALVDGYHADMTRTVAIGEPSSALRRLHGVVRAAQQAGVEAVRPGATTQSVDTACRQVISDAGHADHFVHGTGHGVGLLIHEEPFLGATTAGTLKSGMAITVEPGVYVPGLGGVRIEDVVLVGETGAERLTTAAHDLLIL